MSKSQRQYNPRPLRPAHRPCFHSSKLSIQKSRKPVDKPPESLRQACKVSCNQPVAHLLKALRCPPGSCLTNISVSLGLLTDQFVLTISDLFFQEWQPLMPVVHRPTFLRVYEQYLANPESGNWQNNKQAYAQLFLIFEIAALSHISAQKKSTPSYETQWRKALYSTSSNASLPTLQCHILAQICYMLRADHTHLARHRGIAITMCHELGLHQGHKYHSLAPLDAESRKKVFWCQYTLDKYAIDDARLRAFGLDGILD